MSKPTIKVGDVVKVSWQHINGDIQVVNNVIVLNIPRDIGDWWHFKYEDGSVEACNPMNPNFLAVIKEKQALSQTKEGE